MKEGGWVHGCRSRTMSRAIPGGSFSKEDLENQHEGESIAQRRL
jgi:hypothetical protein